ncbi:hypothetical protein [Pseudomonas sp. 21LCFQ010]|nr:hypothetical protein [Pseudomonas sp. 21LCFQ010]
MNQGLIPQHNGNPPTNRAQANARMTSSCSQTATSLTDARPTSTC